MDSVIGIVMTRRAGTLVVAKQTLSIGTAACTAECSCSLTVLECGSRGTGDSHRNMHDGNVPILNVLDAPSQLQSKVIWTTSSTHVSLTQWQAVLDAMQ